MFPRDPSESSHRQKRSPSPADHSGSNSSPSREYSPPAARRRQTSRAPAKSTTHKHNFSPSRRWEVNCMDFISMNSYSLETSSVALTTCSYVSVVCASNTWALRLFIFCQVTTLRVPVMSRTQVMVQASIFQFLSNVLASGRTSEVWYET